MLESYDSTIVLRSNGNQALVRAFVGDSFNMQFPNSPITFSYKKVFTSYSTLRQTMHAFAEHNIEDTGVVGDTFIRTCSHCVPIAFQKPVPRGGCVHGGKQKIQLFGPE